ncbi:ABC transporter permease subunit [Jiangella rhizosphaerae]|uniref:ABC transporter permease n=1 Tax=Jiangella rhizosphaerae TaxID=2293569 RepID=A0A418KNJ6_9ACTN|nr:ABC transporter permease subunit [Jiangella rhizosphaerae]RIQ20532.1 ABC transporter permease [Jiangella rhizosphaerae]
MSALATTPAAGTHRPARTTRPSLARLTAVELRKATDTRAGFWLLTIIALAALGMVLIQIFTGSAEDRRFAEFFGGAQLPVGLLLPVVGILAVTGEWSQRTTLSTFALEPRRERVIAAKLSAAVLMAVGVVVASLAWAALANVVAPLVTDADASWSFSAEGLGRVVLFQVVNVLVGTAFGLALLNTPLAIVLYFLLPTLWTILGSTISALETPAEWLDLSSTTMPLLDGDLTGEAWAQLGTSLALWLALPLALGLWRVLRSEVK